MTNTKIDAEKSEQMIGMADSLGVSSEDAAHVLFDVVPQVMQQLRAEMRRRRGPEISVLQLRALAFLSRHPGATLSLVAEHVGLTLPSMSSQVSGLVARKLIDRSVSTEDRRYVTLKVTEQGRALLEMARQGAEENLAKNMAALSPRERATVVEAMHLLAHVFAPPTSENLTPSTGASATASVMAPADEQPLSNPTSNPSSQSPHAA